MSHDKNVDKNDTLTDFKRHTVAFLLVHKSSNFYSFLPIVN